MKIQVTEEDINLGVSGQPTSCPVARALSRTFPACQFSVGSRIVQYGQELWGARHKVELPVAAHEFIEAFDLEDPDIGPFEFELPEAVAEFCNDLAAKRVCLPRGIECGDVTQRETGTET